MAKSFPFADDRPCVQLRVAGLFSDDVTLTLLLDLWAPNPSKVMLFPWAISRVRWLHSAAPTEITSHYRYSHLVPGGILSIADGSWFPGTHVNAGLLVPPLGGRNANGTHPLDGVIDGYAGFDLFGNRQLSIDFASKMTVVV